MGVMPRWKRRDLRPRRRQQSIATAATTMTEGMMVARAMVTVQPGAWHAIPSASWLPRGGSDGSGTVGCLWRQDGHADGCNQSSRREMEDGAGLGGSEKRGKREEGERELWSMTKKSRTDKSRTDRSRTKDQEEGTEYF
ncbi:hypothetical protein G6O67_002507 [Ophiocordyceps sinensis]|uniref:Uncharacterized protein n=1 Tax=Ophiocordyceps sinensis TaxID=72228 RepID=A0A8H4PUJ4_9HYPO|nr:hypothetical protein G6O67_002507 [Ophiocordyceps sinensis]